MIQFHQDEGRKKNGIRYNILKENVPNRNESMRFFCFFGVVVADECNHKQQKKFVNSIDYRSFIYCLDELMPNIIPNNKINEKEKNSISNNVKDENPFFTVDRMHNCVPWFQNYQTKKKTNKVTIREIVLIHRQYNECKIIRHQTK